jgi:hypothetical protein
MFAKQYDLFRSNYVRLNLCMQFRRVYEGIDSMGYYGEEENGSKDTKLGRGDAFTEAHRG